MVTIPRKISCFVAVVVILFASACDSGSYDESTIRSVVELERLIYDDYFNSEMQLELARSYWARFEKSSRKSQFDASQCVTAYLISSAESIDDAKIKDEFKPRFEILMAQAGYRSPSFERIYENMKRLYTRITRPKVKKILSLREDFRSLWKTLNQLDKVTPPSLKAYSAVMRHIKIVFDVETGRLNVPGPSGGNLKFASGFYTPWNSGLRNFGIVLPKPEKLISTFLIEEALTSPFPPRTPQAQEGISEGLYILKNSNIIVPGIEYFRIVLREAQNEETKKN